MSYYLKRDLPTIKAGTEIEQGGADSLYWSPVGCIEHFPIPPEVKDDWIEERETENSREPQYPSLEARIKKLEKDMDFVFLSLESNQRIISTLI